MAPARLPVGCKSSRYSYISGSTITGLRWTAIQHRRQKIYNYTGNTCHGNVGGGPRISTVADAGNISVDEEAADDDADDNDNNSSGWRDEQFQQFIADARLSADGSAMGNYYSGCCLSCGRWFCKKRTGYCARAASQPGSWNHPAKLQQRLLRYFSTRRRSKFAIVLSLSLCVTAIKLFATSFTIDPLRGATLDEYSAGSDNRDVVDLLYRQRVGHRGVLSEPDCEALLSGDPRELVLTEAMLFRESRPSTADLRPPNDCSPTWFRRLGFRHVGDSSTLGSASTNSRRRSPIAFLITVDSASALEQTLTLLGSLHDVADIFCLAVRSAVRSGVVKRGVRQVSRCLPNVIGIFQDEEITGSCRRQCTIGRRNCTCNTEQLNGIKTRQNIESTPADWGCVRKLLSPRESQSQYASWTHLVKLSTFHLPVHPRDTLLEFLHRVPIENMSEPHERPPNDVNPSTLTAGRAYGRNAIARLFQTWRHLANAVAIKRSSDSLDGSTIAEDKRNSVILKRDSLSSVSHVIELSTDVNCVGTDENSEISLRDRVRPRCFYVVSDLPFLSRVQTPFAFAFDVERDHLAIRCVLERRTRTQRLFNTSF